LSTDSKVLSHLGFMSKVLPVPLTELIAWVGFCTSRPQQDVKYQLWYLDFFGEHPIYNPWIIDKGWQSSSHLRLKSKVLTVPLTDLYAWVGFCTSSPQKGVKYQLWYLDFFWRDPINIPWKSVNGRQSSFSLGVYVKGIARAFNWLMCLGRFLYLKPTAGCQISTLISGFSF
jgi:hypothetical protein